MKLNFFVLTLFLFFCNCLKSQIEVLKHFNIEGATIISGIKTNGNNIILTLESDKDSFLINNIYFFSKGMTKPITGIDNTVTLCVFDSNYNLLYTHHFFGLRNIHSSRLFIFNEECIYFTIGAFKDSLFFDQSVIKFNSQQTSILFKYNFIKDSLAVINSFNNCEAQSTIIKKFRNNLYISQLFKKDFIIDNIILSTSKSASDWNNVILVFDQNNNNLLDYYYFTGDDFEIINDFIVDGSNNLIVVGSFWGDYVSFAMDSLFNFHPRTYDGFMIAIDSNHKFKFGSTFYGPLDQFANNIFIDETGNYNIIGKYRDLFLECNMDSIINLTNSNKLFSSTFDTLGKLKYITQSSNTNDINTTLGSTFKLNDNNIWICGSFNKELKIDSFFSLKSNNSYDGMLLLCNKSLDWKRGYQISGNGEDLISFITRGKNNNYLIGGNTTSDTLNFLNITIIYKKLSVKSFLFDVNLNDLTKIININGSKLSSPQISPNPCQNYIFLNAAFEEDITSVIFFNLFGQRIFEKEILKGEHIIDGLNNLSNGVYIIIGFDKLHKQLFSEKIIIYNY